MKRQYGQAKIDGWITANANQFRMPHSLYISLDIHRLESEGLHRSQSTRAGWSLGSLT